MIRSLRAARRPRVLMSVGDAADCFYESLTPLDQYGGLDAAATAPGGVRRARLYGVSSAAENRNRQTMSPSQCGASLPTWQPDPVQPTLNMRPICPWRRGGAGGIGSTIRDSSPCFS